MNLRNTFEKRPGRTAVPGLFLILALAVLTGISVYADTAAAVSENAKQYISESTIYNPADWIDEDGNLTPPYEAYPADEGYTGYWILLSEDIWLYTFYADDDSEAYYVWEDEVEGFISDCTSESPYQLADFSEKAMIVNTSENAAETGSLSLSLNVLNSVGEDVNSEAVFAVRITLKDSEGNTFSGTHVYGEYAFCEGTAVVSLSEDKSIQIDDIPQGYGWYIEAVSCEGFAVSYSQQEGEIAADETSYALITAQEKEYVDITISKEITGYYESSDDYYEFEISLENLGAEETYEIVYSGDMYEESSAFITADEDGCAYEVIYLKADESAVLCLIPVGAEYTITEKAGEYTAAYSITDINGAGSIVCASGKNTEENMENSTQTETADPGEAVTAAFTNVLYRTQDVNFTVRSLDAYGETDENDEDLYEIEIHLEGLEAGTEIYYISSLSDVQKTLAASNEGVVSASFELSSGENITLKNLPVGSFYTITQKANGRRASFTITDANNIGSIALSSLANASVNTAISTEKETVNEGEDITVIFINSLYTASAVIYALADEGAVEGAVFDVYASYDDGSSECIASGLETDAGGYTDVIGGLCGGSYYIEETYAPEGYFLSQKVYFEISEEDLGNTKTVTVLKSRAAQLVSAGGIGIYLFLIAGILILLIITLIVLAAGKRKGVRK